MIQTRRTVHGHLIVRWDPCGAWFDEDYVNQRIEKINSLVRKANPTHPEIHITGKSYVSISRIVPKESLKLCSALKQLEQLAAQLDQYHSEGLIHGDIKYSNIIFSNDQISLIDWEPILVYKDKKGTFLRSTEPYIATQDIKVDNLTKSTDKIGFYFLCKRLLDDWKPFTRQDVMPIETKIVSLACQEIFEILSREFSKSQDYLFKPNK